MDSVTRSLAHSFAAEEAIIAAILVHPRLAIPQSIGRIEPEDFYLPGHRAIFEAMCELDAMSKPIDDVTVAQQLESTGTMSALTSLGGSRFLLDVQARFVTAENVSFYVETVAGKAHRRRCVIVAAELMSAGASELDDAAYMNLFESKLFAIARTKRGRSEPIGASQIAKLVADEHDAQLERDASGKQLGVMTGYSQIDAATSGMQSGDLNIIAGRPSMGKSALALNFMLNAATEGVPSLLFSREMMNVVVGQRLAASRSGVNLLNIRTARMTQSARTAEFQALSEIADLPIWSHDAAGLTFPELRSIARRWRSARTTRDSHALIVVDYLQLLDLGSDERNRDREIGRLTAGLKDLGRELGASMLVLSQLNRSLESRENKRPIMSDLRESGSIEQDADVVMFVYRDEVYNGQTSDAGTAEIILAKNRNGPTGTVKLLCDMSIQRFSNREMTT